MTELDSRERMLRALSLEETDRIPCCFMSFSALRKQKDENFFELAKAEREMGLDSMLFVPIAPRPVRPEHPDLRGLPIHFDKTVKTNEWVEDQESGKLLHREYLTPAGKLTGSVRLSDDWPHGNHLPFIDDYQVPRKVSPLVEGPEDLDALQYLLTGPSDHDRAAFEEEVREVRSFVEAEKILLAGGWGVGADMADWLCGMENLMFHMMDNPTFASDLLGMIHRWNLERMSLVLTAGVDLYIRRAWYEGCDFIHPAFFRRVILPQIKAESDLVHERGAKFGYICSSGTVPMLEMYPEAGIDALIGIDPVQGTYTDMPLMKQRIGDEICLWGGVSGAVTVEMGTEEEIRLAVREAVEALGPTGFVLSPVDNITEDHPKTWRNVKTFIDEWVSLCT